MPQCLCDVFILFVGCCDEPTVENRKCRAVFCVWIISCMHACMHALSHAYMHACMHTYNYTNMHALSHAYMHACIHTYSYTNIHHRDSFLCMNVFVCGPLLHTLWNSHPFLVMYLYILHTYVYPYTHHVHTYICTHIHIRRIHENRVSTTYPCAFGLLS